jgi:hypothetical protein
MALGFRMSVIWMMYRASSRKMDLLVSMNGRNETKQGYLRVTTIILTLLSPFLKRYSRDLDDNGDEGV